MSIDDGELAALATEYRIEVGVYAGYGVAPGADEDKCLAIFGAPFLYAMYLVAELLRIGAIGEGIGKFGKNVFGWEGAYLFCGE